MIKINKETQNKEKHTKTFELLFDKDEIQKIRNQIEKKLAKDVEIKGFRKGKAPIEEARKHISVDKLLTDTVDALSSEGYDFLIDQYYDDEAQPKQEINFFIEKPKADLKEFKDDKCEIHYSFDLFPDVTIDLKDMEIKTKDEKATAEEIQKRVDDKLETHATLEPKGENSLIEKGDDAVFDFEGTIDGEKFDGGSAKQYELEIGSNRFIPGFEDQMVGMKINEERDIKVPFPKDYQVKKLAGKDAVFHVTLHEIKKIVRPEYNNEFIKALAIEGVNTDEELRKHFEKEINDDKARVYKDQVMKEISEELLKNVKISYVPSFLVEHEEIRIRDEMTSMLKQYNIKLEDYLKMVGLTNEKLNENFHKEAEQRIKLDIAVNQVAKDNNIKPTEEEINAEIERIEEQYNPKKEKEISERIQSNKPLIAASIIQRKVYDFLFDYLTNKK
ncbi:trigger factor [bacterium]|nr:trigger factor [bacterium]